MQQICDYLNEKGVKSVRGKNVDLNFVRGILHNPRYKGDYVYRDIVIPDGIPQIVSRELYDSVQNILEASKKHLHAKPMKMLIFLQQNCFAEPANRIWSAKAEQVVRGTNTIITDV